MLSMMFQFIMDRCRGTVKMKHFSSKVILLHHSYFKTMLLMIFVILSCQWTVAPGIMVDIICSLIST